MSGLKEGEKLVMMGAADALPAAPTKRIIFEEDLSEADKMVVKQLPSAGLRNLGNTVRSTHDAAERAPMPQ